MSDAFWGIGHFSIEKKREKKEGWVDTQPFYGLILIHTYEEFLFRIKIFYEQGLLRDNSVRYKNCGDYQK